MFSVQTFRLRIEVTEYVFCCISRESMTPMIPLIRLYFLGAVNSNEHIQYFVLFKRNHPLLHQMLHLHMTTSCCADCTYHQVATSYTSDQSSDTKNKMIPDLKQTSAFSSVSIPTKIQKKKPFLPTHQTQSKSPREIHPVNLALVHGPLPHHHAKARGP